MKTLLVALILSAPMFAASASAELPDAPMPVVLMRPLPAPRPIRKPRLDRTDWALLTADAASRALDVYSTRCMLRQGDHEKLLPGFVANHASTMIAYSAGAVAMDYFAARYLVRHRHPRLAKIALMADFAQDAPWAVHNLFLKPGTASHQTIAAPIRFR